MTTTQSGRSMLEMLAVLCVIGVLTVGVLLGYRQGMIRYRTYRAYVEMSEIVEGVYKVCRMWSGLGRCHTQGRNDAQVEQDIQDANIISNMRNSFGIDDYHVRLRENNNSTLSTNFPDNDICEELRAEDWPAGVGDGTGDGANPAAAPVCNAGTLTLTLWDS